jgi:tRNA (mo5U34)-methyltransferase
MPSWTSLLSEAVDHNALFALRAELAKKMHDPRFQFGRDALAMIEGIQTDDWSIEKGTVRIGRAEELNAESHARLLNALNQFQPWKKGPYAIFGHQIDSEWRSDMKWDRVFPDLVTVKGEVIADIGCHNGYFMYRMAAAGAKHVIGFEPVPTHAYNHQLLQALCPVPEISFELFGVEHIDLFPGTFDSIFCMGILYHHTDPIGLLRKMRRALKPKGRLIIDCQGIAGDDPLSLTPSGRYAGASGVWYLPTLSALQNWIRRAGLGQQHVVYSQPLSPEEQRATAWADVKSLADFLDPHDASKTIEGYCAPFRHYVIAKV